VELLRKIEHEANEDRRSRSAWVRHVLEQAVDPDRVPDQIGDPRQMDVAELRESLGAIDSIHDRVPVFVEVVTLSAGFGSSGPRKERLLALKAGRGFCHSGNHPFVIRCERDPS
jgi:hypothetical protein